jgi:hypothetical protein
MELDKFALTKKEAAELRQKVNRDRTIKTIANVDKSIMGIGFVAINPVDLPCMLGLTAGVTSL